MKLTYMRNKKYPLPQHMLDMLGIQVYAIVWCNVENAVKVELIPDDIYTFVEDDL